MLQGAIFDFDGTLADTTWIWRKTVSQLIHTRGRCYDERWLFATAYMEPLEIAGYIIEHYGVPGEPQEIVNQMDEGMRTLYHHAKLKDGVAELLALLWQQKIKMCVATASEKALVSSVLERCGVARFFEEVLSCQDVGRSKRWPDVYLAAAARLGTPVGDTAVFEDMLLAAQTARKAGFPVIAVRDDVSATKEHRQKLQSLAVRYVNTPRELLKDRSWMLTV